MSKMHYIALPVALFFTFLALPGCASKAKETPVAVPAAAEVAAPVEAPTAPEVVPEPAPTPVIVDVQPAPKPKARPAKKKTIKAKPIPKAVPATVVEAPAPILEPEAPVVQPPEPTPPVIAASPAPEIAKAGFLEEYWLWLLALGIVVAGMAVWWKNRGSGH